MFPNRMLLNLFSSDLTWAFSGHLLNTLKWKIINHIIPDMTRNSKRIPSAIMQRLAFHFVTWETLSFETDHFSTGSTGNRRRVMKLFPSNPGGGTSRPLRGISRSGRHDLVAHVECRGGRHPGHFWYFPVFTLRREQKLLITQQSKSPS